MNVMEAIGEAKKGKFVVSKSNPTYIYRWVQETWGPSRLERKVKYSHGKPQEVDDMRICDILSDWAICDSKGNILE